MKGRIAGFLAGLLTLFGLAGCFELEQTIHLKRDGSGTITEELMLGPFLVRLRETKAAGEGEGARAPFEDLYDVEKYKEEAAKYGKGVTYLKMEKIERKGGKGVRVIYAFDDINTVRFAPGSMLDEAGAAEAAEAGPSGRKEEPLTFTYADGALTVTVPPLAKGDRAEEKANDPALQAMALQLSKEMKLRARLTVESGIVQSDATYAQGNTITFLDLDFGKIVENSKGGEVLRKIGSMTRAELKEALKGVPGVRIETKEIVRVKVGE